MQADVINNVMRRIETSMSKYDMRMAESIEQVKNDLHKRFQLQETSISGSIKNLEKYLTEVHDQQIHDFLLLKKFVHALACAKETNTEQDNIKEKLQNQSWVEQQLHAACTKDFMTLTQEQRRHELLIS